MKPSAYVGRMVCVAAVLWIVGNAIVLPWAGRSYIANVMHPGTMRSSGGFQLKEAAGFSRWCPLWNPPRPHSSSITASVRWPWQSVPVQPSVQCIEVDVLTWLLGVSSGIVPLGFLARLLTPATLPMREQQSIHLAWCWAWSALAVFFGYLLTWLVMSQWGTNPSDGVTLIGFFALLIVSSIYSMRFSHVVQMESRDEVLDTQTETLAASRAAWRDAVSMVGGLIAGGVAGCGVAILMIWLIPSRPSPDMPGLGGLGAAIGQLIVGLIGTVSGSVVGVCGAYWWRRSMRSAATQGVPSHRLSGETAIR